MGLQIREIEQIKVDKDYYSVGNQYGLKNRRTLRKIVNLTIHKNPNMACFVGYDEKNKVIFEIYSTNVQVFYK